MKILFFLLFFTLSLFAIDKNDLKQNDIWLDLIKLEKNYSNLFNDSNISMQKKMLENNEILFANIYELLNDKNIFLNDNLTNTFFNDINSYKRISFLNKRIENNSFFNNEIAIYRDMFELNKLTIERHLYSFIKFYYENRNKKDFRKKLISFIKSEKKFLKDYDPLAFKDFIKNNLLSTNLSEIKKVSFSKFSQYKSVYYLYNDFLNYIYKKKEIKVPEKIIEELYINKIISLINNNKYIDLSYLNIFLSKINLDAGRLLGFILIMFLFLFAGVVLNKIIVNNITNKINNNTSYTQNDKELIHSSFFSLKLPLVFLMIITSFHISLWVLYFNTEPNEYIKKTLHTAYILSFYWFFYTLIKIVSLIAINSKKYFNKIKMRQELVNLGILSMKVILTIITFIILLHFWGVNVSGILTGLGVSGVVVAFAAKDLLSNFFGTIKIILDDSYSQGDWISVEGEEGNVASISFGNTKIRTFSNGLITIPNSKMSSSSILNWSRRSHGRQIKTVLTLTYSSKREDLVNAINEINNMLENHPDIATPKKSFHSPERKHKLMSIEDTYGIKRTLFVKFIGFSNSSVDVLIYSYSKTVDWGEFMDVRQDVFLKIWEIIEKNNLEFAFPSQTVYLENNGSNEIFNNN